MNTSTALLAKLLFFSLSLHVKILNIMNLPEPQKLWQFFHEITLIPRPSKKEERILDYLKHFAQERNLTCKQDEAGNLLILKAGMNGGENSPTLAMQAHVDMVCEKNADKLHNFDTDPLTVIMDGDWLKADGTTLGADNGIGMAMMLYCLDSCEIAHPPLECLFTVDEETGLTGAFALSKDLLTARTLINLDSEDDGIIFIGCAGGIGTTYKITPKRIELSEKLFSCKLRVSGLTGGHSGDDIHKGRANSLKIANEYLVRLTHQMPLFLHRFEGGNLHNAIPREAEVEFSVPYREKETIRVLLNIYLSDLEDRFSVTEPRLKIDLESNTLVGPYFEPEYSNSLIKLIDSLPNGVIGMSKDMEGLVETSTNLASIKLKGDELIVVSSQRSSSNQAKTQLALEMKQIGESLGFETIQSDGYPGWQPNLNSAILGIAQNTYETLFASKAQVKAIHAGLECGLFLEKYPHLDMISIGPQMYGVHSPDERLSISSTQKNLNWLIEILKYL